MDKHKFFTEKHKLILIENMNSQMDLSKKLQSLKTLID